MTLDAAAPHLLWPGAGRRMAGTLAWMLAWGLAAAVHVHAQAQPADAGAPPPAEPASAPGYADRLMGDGALPPDIEPGDPRLALRDASGWPRSLSALHRLQQQRVGSDRQDTALTQLRGTLDTPNHGALGLDLSLRWADRRRGDAGVSSGPGTPAASFTLSQRQLPLAGGWQANHFAGTLATLNTDLAQPLLRSGLPARQMRGAAGEWRQAAAGVLLQASAGEAGVFDRLGAGGLATDGSRLQSVGAQVERGDWAWAGQAGHHGAAREALPGSAAASGRALWQSLRWRSALGDAAGGLRERQLLAQLHLLGSRSGEQGRGGAWADLALDDGALSHRLGWHRLPAGLQWLGSEVGADTEGLMARSRWRTRRDVLEAQIDVQHPLAGGASTRQLWAAGRHQLDQLDAWGAQATAQDGPGGRSLQALLYGEGVRGAHSWRGFAGGGRSAQRERLSQLGVDWSVDLDTARTGASAALARTPGEAGTLLELAGQVSGRLGPRLSLEASARGVWRRGGAAVSEVASAGAQWALATGWTLETLLAASRSRAFVPLPGPSGAAPPLQPEASTQTARTLWIGLRHEFTAGSAESPLGGPRHGGGARLEGVLFLDANANGRLDAGEARAAGITVLLDGRWATRTDAQGAFAFAFVARGEHQLSVQSDNLPLPWQVLGDGQRGLGAPPTIRVRIEPRQDVRLEIGAVREAP